jgi:hypothetical protein
MQTVFIGKDGKKRTVLTQQYSSGLYIAIYREGKSIPDQLASTLKESAFHRNFRKKMPNFLKKESSVIPEETVVIFRKFVCDGSIIALFPEVQAIDSRSCCQSYMHVGQHGQAAYELTNQTKLAFPEEYAVLKAELESIGYDLVIRKRISKRWWEKQKEVV